MLFLKSLAWFSTAQAEEFSRGKIFGLTIGNFDGLHLGHQQLFNTLDRQLKQRLEKAGSGFQAAKVVVSFWPHPRRVLQNIRRTDVWRRTEFCSALSFREKYNFLARAGFDIFFQQTFNHRLAGLSAENFLEQILFKIARPEIIVVGEDWSFGKNRGGNVALLKLLAEARGIEVIAVPEVRTPEGERVRTSVVKEAILRADFSALEKILGRPYTISGRVKKGAQRGRELGFPTANLEFFGRVLPPDGIYAAWANTANLTRVPAALYIGSRPMFSGPKRGVEVHLMDGQNHALYGEHLEVELLEKIRDDANFNSLSELKEAVAKDLQAIRQRLGLEKL